LSILQIANQEDFKPKFFNNREAAIVSSLSVFSI